MRERRIEEVRTSFFEKKEAKKLLLLGDLAPLSPQPARTKSFLLLFFKKEALSFPLKNRLFLSVDLVHRGG
jgi:hypothetical protein